MVVQIETEAAAAGESRLGTSSAEGKSVQMIGALHRPDAEPLLLALGYRFLLLALAREDGCGDLGTVTVEGLLGARVRMGLSFHPRSTHHQIPDARSRLWYGEAIACFSAAVSSYSSLVLRAIALARLACYQASWDDLIVAQDLATTPEQLAQVGMWRRVILREMQGMGSACSTPEMCLE